MENHRRIQQLIAFAGILGIAVALAVGIARDNARAVNGPVVHHYPHPARQESRTVRTCVRAAFLADDYAHTHTGGAAERRAITACSRQVGGF